MEPKILCQPDVAHSGDRDILDRKDQGLSDKDEVGRRISKVRDEKRKWNERVKELLGRRLW